MRRLMILVTCCGSLLLPSCASLKESGKEVSAELTAGLKEAGKDIANEVGRELRVSGREILASAREEFGKAGGDLKETLAETLKNVPEIAEAGGKRAAAEVIADRMEREDPAKAAEFRERVERDGFGSAFDWAFGGTGATGILAALWLFVRTRGQKDAIKVMARSVEESTASAEIKALVKAHGGKAPLIAKRIEEAKVA